MLTSTRYALCPVDGKPIDALSGRRGPSGTYCSNACRQKAYRGRQPPAALRKRDRWVRWNLTSDGRKLPLQAARTRNASVSDPRTWSSYTAARKSEVGTGLGYVLGDGIGCIDLDNCLDSAGVLSRLAAEVLGANPDTWVERSQSGRGLHVWGLLNEGPGRTTPDIEVYSRGRYIALGTTFRSGGLAPLVIPESAQSGAPALKHRGTAHV